MSKSFIIGSISKFFHHICCKIKCGINKKLILTSCKMLITTKTNTEVNMSYKHLTLNERNKIEVLKKKAILLEE